MTSAAVVRFVDFALSRRGRVVVALLVALGGAVTAFAHLVEDYLTGDPIVAWDPRFALWLHDHTSRTGVSVFRVVTYAGNAAVLGIAVLAAAVVLVRRGRRNGAALLVVSLGGAAVLNALLKLAFHRPRPEVAFVHLETYSFPSGHAAAVTATATAAGALLVPRVRGLSRRAALAAALLLVVAVVDFSRLYLGVHYLSDVATGTAFGLTWGLVCVIAYVLLGDRDVVELARRRLTSSSTRARSARGRP